MSNEKRDTDAVETTRRDRVRALVREVLATATTVDNSVDALALPTAPPTSSSVATSSLVELRSSPATPPPNAQADFDHDESAKTIITEADVRDLAEGVRLRVAEGVRFTSLADDILRERRIQLVYRVARSSSSASSSSTSGSNSIRTIAIGADHGGFEMKQQLAVLLAATGYHVRDLGTHSTDAVDYPDIAHAVARHVADRQADLGIIIDGAGVGSAMTANKVPGIRAAACYSVAVAKNSREHNNANVLTLGSKTITSDEMREIVRAWLTTELVEERHRKRVEKIEAVGRQYQI